MRPKSKVISFTNISPCFWPVVSMYGPTVVCALSPASYLSVRLPHAIPFRDALPACGPAEGIWPAAGAEEPAAAGPDGLRAAAGWDRKRVRAFPWKTGRPIHLQDQEVKHCVTEIHGVIFINAACLTWASWCVFRKEPSSNTVAQVWVALLSQTRQESGDHSRLSETCSNTLIQPLTQCLEYTQRLAKKVLMSALWGESAPAECSSTQECDRFDSHPCAFPWLRNFVVPWVPSRFCHHN